MNLKCEVGNGKLVLGSGEVVLKFSMALYSFAVPRTMVMDASSILGQRVKPGVLVCCRCF